MENKNNDQDDFYFHAPGMPDKSSSEMVFDAYLQTKNDLSHIPRANRINLEASLHTLLRDKLRADAKGLKLFRKNSNANDKLSSFWLASVSEAASFMQAWRRPPEFRGIDKSFLDSFARLSAKPENIAKTAEYLASAGIILVYEQAIPGMKVDGACFLLPSGRPVVALSLRYARLDIYWFVLMHELAHIHAHYDRLAEPILDDIDAEIENDIEIEANSLAANSLIPRNVWRSANLHYNSSEKHIFELAHKAETHPAIIAGRFQKENKKFHLFAKIVNEINTREIIFGHE